MENDRKRYYASRRRSKTRKTAKNEFSAITGLKAMEMKGGSNCIIVNQLTISGMACARYAYIKYIDHKYGLNINVHVSQSCGVLNCVKREHLIVEYTPSKKDMEYIKGYGSVMDDVELSHILHIPSDLLNRNAYIAF